MSDAFHIIRLLVSPFRQSAAVASLARLIALRSGLPQHPENPEVVDDLGGRDGIERLLGALDDLLANCVDAVTPISNLADVCDTLRQRLTEMDSSYQSCENHDAVRPCNKTTMQQLKVFFDHKMLYPFYVFL